MANLAVAYFQIRTHRSKAAFAQLIGDWTGILVSDGSRVSQAWEGLRQRCLAHLIRAAKGLAESVETGAESAKGSRCECFWTSKAWKRRITSRSALSAAAPITDPRGG